MDYPSKINRVTVLGAGVLGGQIAWHSAFKGKQVTIYEPFEKGIEACKQAFDTYAHIYMTELEVSPADIAQLQENLRFESELAPAVADADLVIEGVPEIPEIKTEVYQKMASLLPSHTLIATNSSSLLPSQFAEATGRPEKFCSLHFANLIWSINLAEVMAHSTTDNSTVERITQYAIEIGMVPIPVQKEVNGYVINSLLIPILHAAQSLITNQAADPETIDRTYMMMNRGCATGPCGMMDVVGFTTIYNIFSYWGEVNNDQQMLANAEYIKQNFIDAGKKGIQNGQGYYQYPNPSYQRADFLDVPDIKDAATFAKLAFTQR